MQRGLRANAGGDRPRLSRVLGSAPRAGAKPCCQAKLRGSTPRPHARSHIVPMLAQIGKGEPPPGDQWLYEIKWDGVRAICYLDDGKLRMVSRNGNVMDRQYPELSILPHHVRAGQAILDAEIAVLDPGGVPSFELLQRRITVSEASAIATLARNHPVVLYVFDLLFLDGYDLRSVTLLERKRLLKEILTTTELIRYSEHFAGNGAALLQAARERGIEGVVGKRASSHYESRRTADWVKYKVVNSDSFVLCGFTKGERDLFGALVLGIYDHGKLTWAGNVGTGFDRKMMQAIHDKLAPLASKRCPLPPDKNLPKEGAVTWTRPELTFAQVPRPREPGRKTSTRVRRSSPGCVPTSIPPSANVNMLKPAGDPPPARAPLLDATAAARGIVNSGGSSA